MLREVVWGPAPRQHIVQVLISRLRQNLEQDPAVPQSLLTEPGAGYPGDTPNLGFVAE